MIDKRQSQVSRSGRSWEDYVEGFLRGALAKLAGRPELGGRVEDLGVVRFPGIPKEARSFCEREGVPFLCEALFIPIPGGQGTYGDADIVMYSKAAQVPIAVVSCKTSLHGRLTESLFYALYYRMTRRFKYVLATPDKGVMSGGRWKSEWGTPEKPTKYRQLAAGFLDGVYVENVPEFIGNHFDHQRDRTATGGIVRPLEELPGDVIRWHEDIKFRLK